MFVRSEPGDGEQDSDLAAADPEPDEHPTRDGLRQHHPGRKQRRHLPRASRGAFWFSTISLGLGYCSALLALSKRIQRERLCFSFYFGSFACSKKVI